MNQVLYYPFGMRFLVLAFLGKVGGQAFSECKFSFTAVTDQQQVFGLSELRFFDKYGDFLDLSGVSGWSPGESTSNLVRQLWDTDLETGWQDESAPSVTNPISLTISFSSPAEVAAYDFFSSHSSSIGKPTAWNVSCQEEPGESWSHMESRTITAPSQLKASYALSVAELTGQTFISNGESPCTHGTISSAADCEAAAGQLGLEWNGCCQDTGNLSYGCTNRVNDGDVIYNGNAGSTTAFGGNRHAICASGAAGLPAFSWASTYPLLNSTLPVGTLLSQCKFVITAHHGTSAGELLLGEVRLYDVYGDVLDVISSATNPGGRRGSVAFFPSEVIDKDLRTSWRDQMSVPSSLVLDLSSPSGVAGYEFYSHISDQDKDPTAWSVYCRESGVAAWSLMESRSEASIPARGSPYAQSAGLPVFTWASPSPPPPREPSPSPSPPPPSTGVVVRLFYDMELRFPRRDEGNTSHNPTAIYPSYHASSQCTQLGGDWVIFSCMDGDVNVSL